MKDGFSAKCKPNFLRLFKLSNGTEGNFSFCWVPLPPDIKINIALNDYIESRLPKNNNT